MAHGAAAIDGPTGHLQWLIDTQSCAKTTADGVVGELLLLTCDDQLQVRDVTTGDLEQTVDLGGRAGLEPARTGPAYGLAAGPTAYTLTGSAVLATSLGAATEPLWTTALPDGFTARQHQPAIVAIHTGLLLIGTTSRADDAAARVWYRGT